jgi:hypothetical protein
LQALAQAVDDLDLTGGGEHHALTGLLDDDHTQYINTTRGDLRYSLITQTHLAILAAAPTVAIAETVLPSTHSLPNSIYGMASTGT